MSTEHFSDAEVACKCGCGMLPQQDFMDKLEALRVAFGRPMRVTSGARCPAHNAAVSSTGRTGPHTTGRAADVEVMGDAAHKLLRLALEAGFTGIGVKQKGVIRFLHFDDLPAAPGQPRPTIWSY